MGERYFGKIVIFTHSVDMPEPCENWVSTPVQQRTIM